MSDYEATREIGAESRLTVAGVRDVPITNVSYDDETETSTFQHNTGLGPIHTITGKRWSGSFEHNGSNEELRSALFDNRGFPVHPKRVTIKVEEYERTVRFKRCIAEARSRDIPSDSNTSTTYDFIAEDMVVDESSSPPRDIYGDPGDTV